MSTASLPSYIPPNFNRTPSYSVEPHAYEQRLALADRLRPRPSGDFVKNSKNGDARLRLSAQEDGLDLPVYGSNGKVEGVVELAKTSGISSVEVKIEGRLRLKEIAEGGTSTANLCLDTALLWIKDPNNVVCPSSLHFSLTLPTTFTYESRTYPLPPTFDVKLEGLPGFNATIEYAVSAIISKPNAVPRIKSKALGISIGATTVSTPFIFHPRTRPAFPIPSPLVPVKGGFNPTPEWRSYESNIRVKTGRSQDITTHLYIPSSRIYCLHQSIPFHLTLVSSAMSLAAYLPFGPTASVSMSSKRATRIQLMRQSTVDVRNAFLKEAKTDIWRVDCIGEGTFRHAGDGSTWISFTGEIKIADNIKVGGFTAAGLSVKDFILLTMNPPDPLRSIFAELRQVVPIRLTTDAWTPNGAGIGAHRRPESEYSIPSTPDEADEGSSIAL